LERICTVALDSPAYSLRDQIKIGSGKSARINEAEIVVWSDRVLERSAG
jgi:hypothetical protein